MSLSWNNHFFKKISFRLTFIYVSLFILSNVILLVFSYFLLKNSLVKRDHDILHDKIMKYAMLYTHDGLDELKKTIQEEKQGDYESQFLIRIGLDKEKTIFFHVPDKVRDFPVAELEKKMSEQSESGLFSVFSLHKKKTSKEVDDEVDLFDVIQMNMSNGYKIQVAINTDDRDDLLERYLKIILIVSVFVFLLGSIGGFIFSRRALSPLRNLIHTMNKVYSGDLNARVPTNDNHDELYEISILFNRMTEKIERLVLNMQDTLDTVAHELKTPLTRLKSTSELALLKKSNEEDYKIALAETIENTSEIVSFINTIMDISEARAGVLKLNLESINSKQVVKEVVDLYSLVAEEKNIKIEVDQQVEFDFMADKNRFKQVLSNLIDNAIKYSSANSEIQINILSADHEFYQISVVDHGCGISKEDLNRIWDRLYRANNAKVEKGLGLGLSLVASICKAHGWLIQAESQLGQGSEFKLKIKKTHL